MIKNLLLLFLILSSYALGHPYQIVIFRHAEKVFAEGFVNDMDALLDAQGQQRAAYLVDFLLQKKLIDQEAHPIGGIYVPRSYVNNTKEGAYNYVRCTQTILPLFHEASAFLKESKNKTIYLNNEFTYREANNVLNHIMKQHFDEETVVICWEHTQIPHLFVGQFEKLKASFPHLGEDRYDMVWVIRFNGTDMTGLTFTQLPSKGFNHPAKESSNVPTHP